MLRALLWILVFGIVVTIIVVPAAYFYTSASLPTLDTEFDLLRVLKLQIESERKSVQMGQYQKSTTPITFDRPDLAALPKDLVALYITERGCPTFFQSPREEGAAWAKRMFGAFFRIEPDGDGWCEKIFADNLSRRIGAKGSLEVVVATHKIHRFLKKDQLVAYDLLTIQLDSGVIGVQDGARALFKKNLADLTMAELAEFALAIPPHGYYSQVIYCNNPNIIRSNRDVVLGRLATVGLIPKDKAKQAIDQPVACVSVK